MITVNVLEHGVCSEDNRENVLYLRKLLDEYRDQGEVEILFPGGTYHFYPDYAVEKLLYISNHDEDTIKKIAFDLTGYKDAKIRGEKAVFIFHTDIIPFYIHKCEGVTVSGITIDYARPAYSEGTIRSVSAHHMELAIDKEKYPYVVNNGRIYFQGENYCHELINGWLEMDAKRMAPVYRIRDLSYNNEWSGSLHAEFTEKCDGVVDIQLKREDQSFPKESKAGNRVILRHHLRTHPAFYLTDSKDVVLKDVLLYHCEGMAVISQFTENIIIDHFDIKIHPQKKRIFTSTADGFHFVYCRGDIIIRECLVENQLDDPVNIHGIYGRIHKRISEREILVELVEGMQKGVKLGAAGDYFAMVNHNTMLKQSENKLEEIFVMNKDFQYMRFEDPIQGAQVGDVVENLNYIPDVLIENCIFRNNRARGLLLTSAGEVVVRNNEFSVPGAAILIEGDSNYWFESGATKHILVEANKFKNCSYVPQWGNAPIQISPSAKSYVEGKRYHKYLEIRNNEFWCYDKRLINAANIEEM